VENEARCLSPDELHHYASGTMAMTDLARADEHVASCAACRARLMPAPRLADASRSLYHSMRGAAAAVSKPIRSRGTWPVRSRLPSSSA
jgi:anti-sigma factor RsiW